VQSLMSDSVPYPLQHASAAAAIATIVSRRHLVITGGQRSSVNKDAGSPDTGHTTMGGSDVSAAPLPPAGAAEPPAPPRLAWAAPPAAAEGGDTAESQGRPAVAAPALNPWLLRREERGVNSGRSNSGGVLPPHAMPDEAPSPTADAAGATLVDVAVDVISPESSSVAARGQTRAVALAAETTKGLPADSMAPR